MSAITHMRFIGATIYCGRKQGRLKLGPDHRYGDAFICPACGTRVPARALKGEDTHG